MLQLLEIQARPGSVKGLRSPSLAVRLRVTDGPAAGQALRRLVARLAERLPPLPPALPELLAEGRADPEGSTVMALGTAVQWIGTAAGIPALEPPKPFRLSPPPAAPAPTDWALFLPTQSLRAAQLALDWLTGALDRTRDRAAGRINGNGAVHDPEEGLEALLERLEGLVPSGVNSRQFLAAAHALDIPAIPRAGGIWQYGMGRHARLMLSTLTDRTPSIGVKLARSKSAANAFLRQAGLPVPDQIRVATEEAAVEAAARFGYPVVIKPEALDGGQGVAAGLPSAEAVRAAFRRAAALSDAVLMERHIPGRDYRLNVFEGRVLFAVERRPGGVTGDGRSTLRALIAQENRDPRRRPERWFQMVPLVIDAEAEELLAEAGLAPDSVPPEGRFVRLRRTANTSRGGTAHPVIDLLHEENARLAIRAAAALRLDLAGVDLITPDIARPWHEQGGAICEVNAQVQIGLSAPQQFGMILQSYMTGQGLGGTGRVPVAVFVTGPGEEALVPRLTRALTETGATPGAATPSRLVAGRSILARAPTGPVFAQVRALLCDTTVDCILVEAEGTGLLDTGLPFDRFDLLHIGRSTEVEPIRTGQLLRQLAEQCAGEIRLHGPAIGDAGVGRALGSRPARNCPDAGDLFARHLGSLQALLDAARAGAAAPA